MEILHGYRDIKGKLKDPVTAIGIFDGIHLGHRRVIKKVLNAAGPKRDAVVITFDPHPQTVLRPKKTPPRIMSIEHRVRILEKMGIDAVVIIKFTSFLAEMTPEDFIKRVISGMGAKQVYVGSNFYFGKGKGGDVAALERIAFSCGIEVKTVNPVRYKGRIASSTWLRKLISSGNIEKAEKLLRRPVSVLGTVVSGDRRGASLGFPTANIDPHQEVIPPPGVYAVKVGIENKLFNGVLNIGFKPTFYGRSLKRRKEPHIEVHIVGFKGVLYGREIEIFFLKRLRRERKFKTADELKRRVEKDLFQAEQFLMSRKAIRKLEQYLGI